VAGDETPRIHFPDRRRSGLAARCERADADPYRRRSHQQHSRRLGRAIALATSPSQFRDGAVYVNRILRGANPRVELVINMKVAGALGLTVPQRLLVDAELIDG
jgi:hypothetical protein